MDSCGVLFLYSAEAREVCFDLLFYTRFSHLCSLCLLWPLASCTRNDQKVMCGQPAWMWHFMWSKHEAISMWNQVSYHYVIALVHVVSRCLMSSLVVIQRLLVNLHTVENDWGITGSEDLVCASQDTWTAELSFTLCICAEKSFSKGKIFPCPSVLWTLPHLCVSSQRGSYANGVHGLETIKPPSHSSQWSVTMQQRPKTQKQVWQTPGSWPPSRRQMLIAGIFEPAAAMI